MENKNQALLILLATLLSLSKAHSHSQQYLSIIHGGLNRTKPQVYIVHVQKQNKTRFLRFSDRRSWYTSFLPNTTLDSGEPRMIYAYRHAISGFAAMLTKKEVMAMEAMDGFLQAYPEETLTMHTTYTPEFLGLSKWDGIWPTTGFGGGKVIGVIDSGVKPTHPSFKDDGMAPRPTNWAGKCYWGRPICNNKLIGAVGYRKGIYRSPDDDDGHGTHTASTTAVPWSTMLKSWAAARDETTPIHISRLILTINICLASSTQIINTQHINSLDLSQAYWGGLMMEGKVVGQLALSPPSTCPDYMVAHVPPRYQVIPISVLQQTPDIPEPIYRPNRYTNKPVYNTRTGMRGSRYTKPAGTRPPHVHYEPRAPHEIQAYKRSNRGSSNDHEIIGETLTLEIKRERRCSTGGTNFKETSLSSSIPRPGEQIFVFIC